MAFGFIDLFAGIGGFHAAMHSFGGVCRLACEIDPAARKVYEDTWRIEPVRDIIDLTDDLDRVPKHDVLCAGFPCQPFSKSGKQLGMDEVRGTLFWNICKIVEHRTPTVVLLENVRNLAGPRHAHEWDVIVRRLQSLGYRIATEPAIFSPHLMPPSMGGTPQNRERVFIAATYVGSSARTESQFLEPLVKPRPVGDWDPHDWDLTDYLDDDAVSDVDDYRIQESHGEIIKIWNELLANLTCTRMPGFPIWADALRETPETEEVPAWKATILEKNAQFYRDNRTVIKKWLTKHNGLADLPPSRRKLEWQAQDAKRDLYECLLHLRPSGIRAKRLTYVPALVAITQTSIIGPRRRRLMPHEAARLQGLQMVNFGDQPDSATYRQLGNAVSVGAVRYVFQQLVLQDARIIEERCPAITDAVMPTTEEHPPMLRPLTLEFS
jgi:DNA (cytosine-5)-methyltransferase 1